MYTPKTFFDGGNDDLIGPSIKNKIQSAADKLISVCALRLRPRIDTLLRPVCDIPDLRVEQTN